MLQALLFKNFISVHAGIEKRTEHRMWWVRNICNYGPKSCKADKQIDVIFTN